VLTAYYNTTRRSIKEMYILYLRDLITPHSSSKTFWQLFLAEEWYMKYFYYT